MAISSFAKNFSHGSLIIKDGTGTPLTHTLTVDMGDYAIAGVVPGMREVTDYERRGVYYSSAFTTRKYPTVTFTCLLNEFANSAVGEGSVIDFLFAQTGDYSARVSTIAPSGATAGKVPFACSIHFTLETSSFGDGTDEELVATKCRIESVDFAEGDPNTLTFSFKVLGAMTGPWAATPATN